MSKIYQEFNTLEQRASLKNNETIEVYLVRPKCIEVDPLSRLLPPVY
jgi:hypothetical protein